MVRERNAVRAILLTPECEILLLRISIPGANDAFWITPGGEIELGESVQQALKRELEEEVGLKDFEIGPLVWRRQHTFTWCLERICQYEEYYVVPVNRFKPTMSDTTELEFLSQFCWWPVPELASSAERLVPLQLGQIVTNYVAVGPPHEPLDIEVSVD